MPLLTTGPAVAGPATGHPGGPARWLVTGASGFIGSHLVGALAAAGCEVVGVDRRMPAVALPGVSHHQLDLTDPEAWPALRQLCGWVEVVVHLAGRPGVRGRSLALERARWRDNVVATTALLEAVPTHTPVVIASSSAVYGGATGADGCLRPSRETDPLRPRGGYARSKAAVERLCARARADGRPVTTVRPFTVVGERQRSDMALARWLDAVRAGRPLVVYGSLRRRRDLVDVRTVVWGIRRIVEVGFVGVVNLGSGTAVALGDVIDTIAVVVGHRPAVRVVAGPSEEVEASWADTTRCRRVLGEPPATDLTDVVRRQLTSAHRVQEAVS